MHGCFVEVVLLLVPQTFMTYAIVQTWCAQNVLLIGEYGHEKQLQNRVRAYAYMLCTTTPVISPCLKPHKS